MAPVPVVYDVNVLVGAAAGGNSPFRSWPSPPPTSGNPFADCLGIVVDAEELFAPLTVGFALLADLIKIGRVEAIGQD